LLPEVDDPADAHNHSFDEDDANMMSPDRKGESMPQEGTKIQLSWHDIKIQAEPAPGKCGKKAVGETKVILDGVSGSALPGQFISIIGASGAGKTTLLNHLSGRLIANNLTKSGTIKINNVDSKDVKGFSAFSAYVQQDDILFETMTVRECLEFSAKLKLPGTTEEKMQKVENIISDLKLTKCQNTFIGGYLIKGVSGGERKRTSIGVELITNPSLIFLDEPTTGLDSYTAT
jgi:ABC-type multidrug transport system ATPase subunit